MTAYYVVFNSAGTDFKLFTNFSRALEDAWLESTAAQGPISVYENGSSNQEPPTLIATVTGKY